MCIYVCMYECNVGMYPCICLYVCMYIGMQ